MQVDLQPAEDLFLTLHQAMTLLNTPNKELEDKAKNSKRHKFDLVLVDCFNPSECWYREFTIYLTVAWDETRGERLAFLTVTDEDLGNLRNIISIDLTDITKPISEHWESLIRLIAVSHPETLGRIAIAGAHIDHSRTVPLKDRTTGLHKFCDFQRNQYISLVKSFADLEVQEND
ncbi:hypothetical protein [Vibrio phage pTD1]|uniref:Uncharacterized protein n=1 Tax=Vibrio phage pTD1 TaxID=1938577 RepID=A0A1Q2U2M8_9CAUD|nr:hypothetical protein FDH33_gp005 [Vibrio phage pTD1]BAW98214.1 hypothetical protein [Vibrio phage pTD1]